jgi:endo-1,4-beta-mannosidase
MRRVRRIGLAVAGIGIATLSVLAVTPPTPGRAASQLPAVTVSQLSQLREVNYYPANGAWTYMWTKFNPTVIGQDFAKIRALGANTVRIFVQPSVFGYPTVTPSMASELAQVISLAQQNSLLVHLTLFDWWNNPTDITGSKQWVTSLLTPYQGDSEIAIIELHNEVNPDSATAVTWVQTMLPYLSTVMPGTLRTVSVASIAPSEFEQFVQDLKNTPPDFWDYHYFGSAAGASSTLSQVAADAAPLPLIIGETGNSTAAATATTQSAVYQTQANYFKAVFAAAASLKLPDPVPWTLNDFAAGAIPPGSTANSPAQYGYGLYTVSGTAKPSAAVVQSEFAGS